ncbi:MAG TPA: hypothetical protein PLW32_08765, partial [Chitinophagaceae bacterium]|nr:hypothetical protein [Chitinophagaceae bacterium]
MRRIYSSLIKNALLLALFLVSFQSNSQCLTATNGLWPTATFAPTCTGTAQSITTAGYASEYSNVALTAGVTYIFSSSNAADLITISDATGATS